MSIEQLEQIVTVLLIAALAVSVGYRLYLFITANRRTYKNSRAPVITTRATIAAIRKTSENIVFASRTNRTSSDVFYITFHADIGGEIEIYTDGNHAYLMHIGDTGELTYQGTLLWDFVPEET